MKLIENFKDLMVNHPEDFARTKMKDLFVFEDGDLEKYPDARMFVDHHWDGEDLLRTLNDFRKPYGFFRKKNSKADLEAQKDIAKRFPFNAISKVYGIRKVLYMWRVWEDSRKEYLDEISNIPEAEVFDYLNKGEE